MTLIDDDALVPIDALVSYAQRLGWAERGIKRKSVRVFAPPQSETDRELDQLKLVVPASAEYEDSVERIRNAIRLLAGFHDATPNEIIRSIREPLIDVVTIRPIWRFGGKGPLGITTMSKLMSLTENFMTQLIARQMQRTTDDRVSIVAARNNTSNIAVRLIEPDTLELESPLTSSYGARVPFARLVTIRLAKGLSLLRVAQESKAIDGLISPEASFDRDVYLALLKLLEIDQISSIRVGIAFGARYPLDEVQGFEAVTLGAAIKPLLKQAVERLSKTEEEPIQAIEVTGRVADINQKSKDELFTFSVEVSAYLRPEKYWIQLDSKFLSDVVTAKYKQLPLRIDGQLQLKGKRKYIVALKNWKILEG